MLNKRALSTLVDLVVNVARTLDGAIERGSVNNARMALVEGRRKQVLRMLLENEEEREIADAAPVPAALGG